MPNLLQMFSPIPKDWAVEVSFCTLGNKSLQDKCPLASISANQALEGRKKIKCGVKSALLLHHSPAPRASKLVLWRQYVSFDLLGRMPLWKCSIFTRVNWKGTYIQQIDLIMLSQIRSGFKWDTQRAPQGRGRSKDNKYCKEPCHVPVHLKKGAGKTGMGWGHTNKPSDIFGQVRDVL